MQCEDKNYSYILIHFKIDHTYDPRSAHDYGSPFLSTQEKSHEGETLKFLLQHNVT